VTLSVVVLAMSAAASVPIPAYERPAERDTAGTGSTLPASGDEVTLLQLNLCLSGMGSCSGHGPPAAAVAEALARIGEDDPDLVVVNEACSGDATRIASATGLHLTFFAVNYAGAVLACRDPGGRGVFGNAILTGKMPAARRDTAYELQSDPEQRRVSCVVTDGLSVCGTHLSTRHTSHAEAINDAQCAELSRLLTVSARTWPTVAAGDMNRTKTCAPPGWWRRTDAEADQFPGVQQVYGDRRTTAASVEVQPMIHTDHCALLGDVRLRVWPGTRSAQVRPHDHARESPGDRVGVGGLGEAGSLEEGAGAHVGHSQVDLLALVVHRIAFDRRCLL
jgi:endonuclease/exonuclease/phosphatase family metal-dependent hydrolase